VVMWGVQNYLLRRDAVVLLHVHLCALWWLTVAPS
jgi:hypothetical protein